MYRGLFLTQGGDMLSRTCPTRRAQRARARALVFYPRRHAGPFPLPRDALPPNQTDRKHVNWGRKHEAYALSDTAEPEEGALPLSPRKQKGNDLKADASPEREAAAERSSQASPLGPAR